MKTRTGFSGPKRVSEPLGESARARLEHGEPGAGVLVAPLGLVRHSPGRRARYGRSASMSLVFTHADTRVKHSRLCAATTMPILVLLLISLAAGALVAYAGSRYPDAGRRAATGGCRGRADRDRPREEPLASAPRPRPAGSSDGDRSRPDARSRAGDRRRCPDRDPRVPRPQQRDARARGLLGRAVGRRQRHELVDRRASIDHPARQHVLHRHRARRRGRRGVRPHSEPLGPGLPRDGHGRRRPAREHDQGHPRPRASDLRSRSPRRSGRRFRADTPAAAAAFYAAAALVLARRRSPRTRALLAGGAVAIAVAVACSRVLLGVHWMSDVIAGLAFGWAWFGICAIAFGGRFLVLGAPVRAGGRERRARASVRARRVRRRRGGSAAGRAGAAAAARHPAASRVDA